MTHEHEWTWQWFGMRRHEGPRGVSDDAAAIRTCVCGDIEWVDPPLGYSPSQAARNAEADAREEARRARQREYNARAKAARLALAERSVTP